MKIAVIFPGIGYHADKPLLYYSKKLAMTYGYDIMEIQYGTLPSGIKGNQEKMREAFEKAIRYAEEQLKNIDWSSYEDILFISKSIGTAVAAALDQKKNLLAGQIYYTPVEASFQAIGTRGIVFHGTGDPWAATDVVESECQKRKLKLYEIPKANHSLETGKVQEDLKNMMVVMRETEQYIAQRRKEKETME